MRISARIAMTLIFGVIAIAEARIPALEEDSLFLKQIESKQASEPKVYGWVALASGPMFYPVRSDIEGWLKSSLSVSASTRQGWLMTVRFPEIGFSPPGLFTPAYDSAIAEDSLFGFSVLAGKRMRWKHGHLSLAAGIIHAQGVQVQSYDSCKALFRGCIQIIESKERFQEIGPILQFEGLTGWRYFAVGAGIELLGTRHQMWGWHIQWIGGRVF